MTRRSALPSGQDRAIILTDLIILILEWLDTLMIGASIQNNDLEGSGLSMARDSRATNVEWQRRNFTFKRKWGEGDGMSKSMALPDLSSVMT